MIRAVRTHPHDRDPVDPRTVAAMIDAIDRGLYRIVAAGPRHGPRTVTENLEVETSPSLWTEDDLDLPIASGRLRWHPEPPTPGHVAREVATRYARAGRTAVARPTSIDPRALPDIRVSHTLSLAIDLSRIPDGLTILDRIEAFGALQLELAREALSLPPATEHERALIDEGLAAVVAMAEPDNRRPTWEDVMATGATPWSEAMISANDGSEIEIAIWTDGVDEQPLALVPPCVSIVHAREDVVVDGVRTTGPHPAILIDAHDVWVVPENMPDPLEIIRAVDALQRNAGIPRSGPVDDAPTDPRPGDAG